MFGPCQAVGDDNFKVSAVIGDLKSLVMNAVKCSLENSLFVSCLPWITMTLGLMTSHFLGLNSIYHGFSNFVGARWGINGGKPVGGRGVGYWFQVGEVPWLDELLKQSRVETAMIFWGSLPINFLELCTSRCSISQVPCLPSRLESSLKGSMDEIEIEKATPKQSITTGITNVYWSYEY